MINLFCPNIVEQPILQKLTEVLTSGYIGQGKVVKEFESNLEKKLGCKNLITTNSCTSALKIALKLIPKKGVVLTTPLTCVATTNAILLDGRFELVWLDVDPNTCNIDLDSLQECINKYNPVAIMMVHWGGYPNHLQKVKEIVGSIPVIEDCAHAFGSYYQGKPIGSHGNLAAFSFGPIKHLTCGDGGALVTRTEDECRQANLLRWYGINRDERESEKNYSILGDKCNMNDINAAIGDVNLKRIDDILNVSRKNALEYDELLSNIDGIEFLERHKDCESSFWLYTIKVENRKEFELAMKSRGVETCLHHSRNDIFSFESNKRFRNLPKLDSFYDKLTNLPMRNVKCVVDCIRKGW